MNINVRLLNYKALPFLFEKKKTEEEFNFHRGNEIMNKKDFALKIKYIIYNENARFLFKEFGLLAS